MGDTQKLIRKGARKHGFLALDPRGEPYVIPFTADTTMGGDGNPVTPPVPTGELLVADGVGPPPETLYNEAGDDWLYADGV